LGKPGAVLRRAVGENKFNHKEPSAATPQPRKKRDNHKEHKGHKVGARFIAPSDEDRDYLTAKNAKCAKKESGFVATVLKVKWSEEKKFQTSKFYV
jgi:hypothetical protein